MTSLLLSGQFTLNSGLVSDFKIDCDALDDVSIATAAHLLWQQVAPYGSVHGVPTGGMRIAAALQELSEPEHPGAVTVVADDVWTTGRSLTEKRKEVGAEIGVVLFARNPVPLWVTPLFICFITDSRI